MIIPQNYPLWFVAPGVVAPCRVVGWLLDEDGTSVPLVEGVHPKADGWQTVRKYGDALELIREFDAESEAELGREASNQWFEQDWGTQPFPYAARSITDTVGITDNVVIEFNGLAVAA